MYINLLYPSPYISLTALSPTLYKINAMNWNNWKPAYCEAFERRTVRFWYNWSM